MGFPLCPIIANIYTEDFEDVALNHYLYGIAMSTMPSQSFDDFTLHLNTLDPSIQFTNVEPSLSSILWFTLNMMEHLKPVYRKPSSYLQQRRNNRVSQKIQPASESPQ